MLDVEDLQDSVGVVQGKVEDLHDPGLQDAANGADRLPGSMDTHR